MNTLIYTNDKYNFGVYLCDEIQKEDSCALCENGRVYINLNGKIINLHSIVHELYHAIRFFEITDRVQGIEDGAHVIEELFEEILIALYNLEYKIVSKPDDGFNVWNIGREVCLGK